MANARFLNKPEDYKKLGVNPEKVEIWEDGRRNPSGKENWEWWYFDSILDDGTSVVIQFFTKSSKHMKDKGDYPKFAITVTLPDGTVYMEDPEFKLDECSWGNDKCDIKYGEHYFTGDLKEYSIHIDPINGLGADLKLNSLSSPYRPGSAYIDFGSDDNFYTWLCVVPKGEVTGTLTINGKKVTVHGFGYHDHQWGHGNLLKEWNHWVWSRQSFEDYSILVFDMVSSKNTNFTRFPIVFVQDKDGNIVFESTDNVTCEVLGEYHDDEASGKDYPKALHYIFENKGKKVDYTLKMQKIIRSNGTKNMTVPQKMLVKMMGLNPAYTRYCATGDMIFTDGGETVERSGNLIYEFMYPGETYKGHI